ncbi:MAG: amidohydrolase, partial [Oscillospiraceae bacterium]|nr:amidohydrolase [Oscillospiraceae bacterium]
MEKIDGLNKWIKEWYDENEADLDNMMHTIWSNPEVGLNNKFAAETAAAFARTHGFPDAMLMRAGQGIVPSDNPNTVFATYGSGKPVIAIVGELDALPNLGNKDVPYRDPVEGPGHGCGHNLIAGSCMGAACALR